MSYISIVIPTKNAGPGFRQTLEAIYAQAVPFECDVLVVDSGSTDETLSICREFPLTLMAIPPDDFSHSQTRNDAIRRIHSKYVVLTVQDALPANETWLANLVKPLTDDHLVAGAYSRQTPRPEADYYTRKMFDLWGMSSTEPLIREITDRAAYEKLTWGEKSHFCAFSNVSSIIRSSIWKDIPFPNLEYAEDLAWARAVLERGYRLAYVPDSVVVHSHQRSWMAHLQRAYIDGKVVPQVFDADVPFPGEEAIASTAQLLHRELNASRPFSEAVWQVQIEDARPSRFLSADSITLLLGEKSLWMADSPAERKEEYFMRKLFEELVKDHKRVHAVYRNLVETWLRAISWPVIGPGIHRLFLWRFGPLLERMWANWVLFWGILSGRIGSPVPMKVTNDILSYAQKFSPSSQEERTNVWLHVLISTAGKYLGRASWAAKYHDIDSVTLQRIEQWLLEERDRP
jgi:rhamnosyltransferase